jgi:DNA repair exonuclease SbcCD ATPase subunit
MKISALALDGSQARPDMRIDAVEPGLNVFFGPSGSGKTALAGLISHVLYGRSPTRELRAPCESLPAGQVVIESGGGRYRLRRHQDVTSTCRLTIASLDGPRVEPAAMRDMLHGLSPSLAARLYTLDFRDPPQLETMLSAELVGDLLSVDDDRTNGRAALTAELLARRETLAHDLESRVSDGRRAGRELSDQRSELDRLIQQRQEELSKSRDQLHAVDTALAETDARLRYLRLETSLGQQWSTEFVDCGAQLAKLDEDIAHWRTALVDLDRRQSDVRGRIAQIAAGDAATAHADARAWLSIARQLATDLEGEVARLARASTSHECVCGDAHPRLRPIVETLARQLDVFESLLKRQQRAAEVNELQEEAEHLARTEAEVRRQVEYLLGRRERLVLSGRCGRSPDRATPLTAGLRHPCAGSGDPHTTNSTEVVVEAEDGPFFTAADAQQLELRRSELEQQRYELCSRTADIEPELAELRLEREAIDRRRARLLSDRDIDQVQQELAAIERQLQQATAPSANRAATNGNVGGPDRVSDFLAQLTGGELIRAELSLASGTAEVVNRTGEKVPCSRLRPARQDQLYLSVCLALVTACEGRGIRLPLVLDEPFLRLDPHDTAALAAVLDDLGRRGCQVMAFTGQRPATERFTALGVCVHDLSGLCHERSAA